MITPTYYDAVGDRKCFSYLNKPHEKRFKIFYFTVTNKIMVRERKTDQRAYFSPMEFCIGQGMYNEKTEKYPDYVHRAVWILFDNCKNF